MSEGATLRAGEWVEVRSKAEILHTLDSLGEHEKLPFMPEMLQYCGRRFQVFRRAHKTCDPPSGLQARRMPGAVHLVGVRCDGEAHGGCQAGCLIFWKEAWLKRVADEDDPPSPRAAPLERSTVSAGPLASCSEADLFARARATEAKGDGDTVRYVCQSTRVSAATTPLPWWDLRQYVEDVRSGNVRLSTMVGTFVLFVYLALAEAGLGIGGAMRWLWDIVQKAFGGTPCPVWRASTACEGRAPVASLGLQAGEMVKVRGYAEILGTLDPRSRNQGMYFDAEQVPFCDKTYRVLRRVERIVDEKTGRMVRLRNEAVILDGVVCQARYAKGRRFCSRSIYPYWRPSWLDRVAEAGSPIDMGSELGRDRSRENAGG
jgi:hypothetical protein